MFQVDPQCIIQYVHWYYEPETGEKRLIKTGKNSSEPYSHVIEEVLEADFGRYYCLIANVMGETECTAYLSIRSNAPILSSSAATAIFLPILFIFIQYLFLQFSSHVIQVVHQKCYPYSSWNYICIAEIWAAVLTINAH